MPNRQINFLSRWWACYDQHSWAKTRLFCFPHGGASPSAYEHLSNQLAISSHSLSPSDNEQLTKSSPLCELYALCLPGRGTRRKEAPYTDIQRLAQDVVVSMHPFIHDKPFALFGHSVGALLAFEVARILEKEKGCPALQVFLSAHCAPEDINTDMYRWDDEQLLSLLRELDSVEVDYDSHTELLKLNLPVLRADFEWAETYKPNIQKKNISDNAWVLEKTPLTLLGGKKDKLCTEKQLSGWFSHCIANTSTYLFSGGHFYWHDQLTALVDTINKSIDKSFNKLESSVLIGPQRSDYPLHLCTHEVFEQMLSAMDKQDQFLAKSTMGKSSNVNSQKRLAIVDPASSHDISYWQLNLAAERVAEFLHEIPDFKRSSFIAIYMEHSIAYFILMLGISKAGGCYLPIETHSTTVMVKKTLQKCKPVILFSSTQWINTALECNPSNDPILLATIDVDGHQITQLNTIDTKPRTFEPILLLTDENKPQSDCEDSIQDLINKRHKRRPDCKPTPEDPIFVCMTSGTTGEPKAIIDNHRAMINSFFYRYENFQYKNSNSAYEREAMKIFFIWEALRPLMQGHTAIIIPDEVIFEPNELVDFLATYEINRVLLTPSLCNEILNRNNHQTAQTSREPKSSFEPVTTLSDQLPELTHIVLNGEVLLVETINELKRQLPQVTLINDYSIAETWDVCTHDVTSSANNNPFLSHAFASAGLPQANQRVYIVDVPDNKTSDPNHWSLCKQGQIGEVFVAGPTLMCGYFNDPSRTHQRLLPDVFFNTLLDHKKCTADNIEWWNSQDKNTHFEPKMFRTGDIGRMLANGHLEICGRTQYMVKLRGYTVVLGAIESAMCDYPDIHTACVIAVNSPLTQQTEHLVAYYTLNKKVNRDGLEKKLRQFLRVNLPHYSVPAFFMELDTLPINKISGKLDKKKLPPFNHINTSAMSASLTMTEPSTTRSQLPNHHDTRHALLTDIVTQSFHDILNTDIPNQSISFFDLGGQSLLAIRLCSLLNDRLAAVLQKNQTSTNKSMTKKTGFIRVTQVFDHSSVDQIVNFLLHKIANHVFLWIEKSNTEISQAEKASDSDEAFIKKQKQRLFSGIQYQHNKGDTAEPPAIAIVGTACRFPGEANSIDEYFSNLLAGRNCFRDISDTELLSKGITKTQLEDENYRKIGAFVEGVDDFDYRFFNMSAREALYLDPQHRLFLECCWEALEDAGYVASKLDQNGTQTGVFGSLFLPSYLINNLQGGELQLSEQINPQLAHITEIGNDKDYAPSRVAHLMDLHGPAVAIQTSCSSGLSVIAAACNAILNGDCDRALAGASSLTFPQAGYLFSEGAFLSKSGKVKPFDSTADGTIFSDGCGVVFLKKLEDAQRDQDDILALIRSQGWNNDGKRKLGYSEPSSRGQSEAIIKCLTPFLNHPETPVLNTLGYVECHGTGTLVGDPIEVEAMTSAIKQAERLCDKSTNNKNAKTYIGSVKANIGHSNIAAGMAGLLKTAMVVNSGKIPPTINIKNPNEALSEVFEEYNRFHLATEETSRFVNEKNENKKRVSDSFVDKYTPFPDDENHSPRFALTSSLGIGGTNCYLLLQQYQSLRNATPSTNSPNDPWQKYDSRLLEQCCLLLFSAKSQESLDRILTNQIIRIQKESQPNWESLTKTLVFGREHFLEHRAFLSIAFSGTESAQEKKLAIVKALKQAVHQTKKKSKKVKAEQSDTTIVLLFPGQGSQHEEMATDLYESVPLFKHHIDNCCEILRETVVPRVHQYAEEFKRNELTLPNEIWLMLDDFASMLFIKKPAKEVIDSSIYIQLSLFIVEYALGQTYLALFTIEEKHLARKPLQYHCIGHSLGEYVALCIAGRLSLADALFIVTTRALLMMRAEYSINRPLESIKISTPEPLTGMLAVQGSNAKLIKLLLQKLWKKMLYEMRHLSTQGVAFTTDRLFSNTNPYKIKKRIINNDSVWSFYGQPIVDHDAIIIESLLKRVQHFVKNHHDLTAPDSHATDDESYFSDQAMITIAAVNSPVDIVLSGFKKELRLCGEFLETLFHFKSAEVKTPVANHHAYFLNDPSEQLARICKREDICIRAVSEKHQQFTAFSNLTGKPHKEETTTKRHHYFSEHMTSSVDFASNLAHSYKIATKNTESATSKKYLAIEVGPGTVLSSLTKKQIASSNNAQSDSTSSSQTMILNAMRHPACAIDTDLSSFLSTLGETWKKDFAQVNWHLLYKKDDFIKKRGICPTYAWDKESCFVQPAANPSQTRKASSVPDLQKTSHKEKLLDLDSRYFIPSWQLTGSINEPNHSSNLKQERILLIDAGSDQHSGKGNNQCKHLNSALCEYFELLGAITSSVGFSSSDSLKKIESALDQLTHSKQAQDTDEAHTKITLIYTDFANADLSNGADFFYNTDAPYKDDGPETLRLSASAKWKKLFLLCQMLSSNPTYADQPVTVLTNRMFQIGQNIGIDQKPASPSKAMLLGPLTVIPQENPHCHFRLIDLGESLNDGQLNTRKTPAFSRLFRIFAAVSKEIFDNVHSEKIVALRVIERKSTNIQRFVPRYKQIYLNETHEKRGKELLIPLNNTTERVFLITGGLGRIGMTICAMLVNLCEQNNRTKVRVVLTTRNDFPSKNDWHNLINDKNNSQSISKKVDECIRQLIQLEKSSDSLEIVIKKLNFSCYQDTQALIHEFFSGNTGGVVFHCAGLAQLAYAQEINQSLWDKEFSPKINGTIYLSNALTLLCKQREEKNKVTALALDSRITMINFSSMASILGGFGMTAYCSANRFQDHFSAFLNARPIKATENNFQLLNLNWDDWDFDYDDQQISSKAYAGIRHFSMTPDEGIKSLLRVIGNSIETDDSLLQKNTSQILVATRNVSDRIKNWLEKEPMEKTHICLSPEQTNQISHITDGAIAESNTSKEGILKDSVMNIYSQILGCDNITLDTNLFELGGDSLSASEILVALHKISAEMQKIRIKDVLNHASPGELISFIMTMS